MSGALMYHSFAPHFGEGYLTTLLLDEGLSLLYWKASLHNDFVVTNPGAANNDLLMLALYQNSYPIEVQLGYESVDNRVIRESSGYSVHKGEHDYLFSCPGQIQSAGCFIYLTKSWFERHIPTEQSAPGLYDGIGVLPIFRPLSAPYQTLLTKLEISLNELFPWTLLAIKSTVYALAVTFLQGLLQDSTELSRIERINKLDMQQLLAIEKRILDDLSTLPPSISILAQEVSMSESKLKRLFRRVFGRGIHEYFQASRMQKGYDLIQSRQMTVSETARHLGFRHTSNFTTAFKKKFGSLPKDIHKI